MLAHAARTIGDGFRSLHALGGRVVASARRLHPATALVFALALGWLAATGWWNYVRPHDFDAKAYERYQEEVANCREFKTSEARYDCVAKALIRRDHVNFGTALFVFLPPLLLLFGRYIWREVRANMREREHARLAEERSRRNLSKYRREMLEERAAARAARALIEEEARQRRLYDPRPPRPSAPHPPQSKRA